MYAKFNVSRDTANDFIGLLVNRRAYSIQAHQPLPNGKVPYYLARDWKTKEPKLLNADAVRMHLNGDITINLYAINPETQRSKWVAIDGDFDGAVEALFRLQWELKQDGVEAAIEQSRRGGHLWIFAATPLMASECRIYIYNVALRLGVPVVGGGLKQGIEVFPKQDRLEDGVPPDSLERFVVACLPFPWLSSSGGDDANRVLKLGKRTWYLGVNHGSIRGSRPIAISGYPRRHSVTQ